MSWIRRCAYILTPETYTFGHPLNFSAWSKKGRERSKTLQTVLVLKMPLHLDVAIITVMLSVTRLLTSEHHKEKECQISNAGNVRLCLLRICLPVPSLNVFLKQFAG